MANEKREVEIKSRADTIPLTSPEVRPWPVTPPPPPEEVTKVYEKRRAGEFGKWCEDNLRFEKGFGKPEALQGLKVLDIGLWRMGDTSSLPPCSPRREPRWSASNRPGGTR